MFVARRVAFSTHCRLQCSPFWPTSGQSWTPSKLRRPRKAKAPHQGMMRGFHGGQFIFSGEKAAPVSLRGQPRHQPGYHITTNAQLRTTNHLGELFIAIRRPGFAGNCRGCRKCCVANRNCRLAFLFMCLHRGALVRVAACCRHLGGPVVGIFFISLDLTYGCQCQKDCNHCLG